MKTLFSSRVGSSMKFVAVALICAAVLLSSLNAVAEDPIPFKAMMQSAGAQTAVPPKPQPDQQAQPGPISSAGKAEIVGGFVLLAAGVATLTVTAWASRSAFRPSGAKVPAGYAAGAGATVAGVTLVALGFHKHKAK